MQVVQQSGTPKKYSTWMYSTVACSSPIHLVMQYYFSLEQVITFTWKVQQLRRGSVAQFFDKCFFYADRFLGEIAL